MGIFTEGTPLRWLEISPHLERIKECALEEFIGLYNQLRNRNGWDQLRWGDEIEYTLVQFDDANKKVRLSLRAEELLEEMSAFEAMNDVVGYENRTLWRPEFGSHMIEGTPGIPYGGLLESFRDVEKNMFLRRAELTRLLAPNESLMSISFPAFGTPGFTDPPLDEENGTGSSSSQCNGWAPTDDESNRLVWSSDFFNDGIHNKSHPRFLFLTRNIIDRRGGERMFANIPIFHDKFTPNPFIEEFADPRFHHERALPNHIFLDHVGFGTGLCCLQVTIQGSNQDEARWLYDQLAPLTPLMVALSAATPIHRGILSDLDARWSVISKLADDRTPSECLKRAKGRFDTVDCFLHPSSAPFNDVPVECDPRVLRQLLNAGVDPLMAQHIAHMFIWDPLLVYAESVEQLQQAHPPHFGAPAASMHHFDSILSCIWSSLRFKPPPSAQCRRLGWRVEFRPMEVQLTDFENAAFCCFLVLLTRVLLSDRLSLVLPISMIDENMRRAQQRDAVLGQRFYFRTGLHMDLPRKTTENGDAMVNGNGVRENGKMMTDDGDAGNGTGMANGEGKEDSDVDSDAENGNGNGQLGIREMSMDEIINGTESGDFPGLVPLCLGWLDAAGDAPLDVGTRGLILEYLQFIQKRASGECATLARWMRDFVGAHPDYRKDSICPDSAIFDMLKEMDRIATGEQRCERLLGQFGQRNWLLEAKALGSSRWRSRQGSISRQQSMKAGGGMVAVKMPDECENCRAR